MPQLQPRMQHPVYVLPEAFKALMALSEAAKEAGLPQETVYLVHLRASQINRCSYCAKMHAKELRDAGASDERIFTVVAWREAPWFSDAERAALALTEAVTRLSDAGEPVSDEVWEEAARHYDERALSALLVEIGSINVWNRLNAATRQPADANAG